MKTFVVGANAYLLETHRGPLLVDSGTPQNKARLKRLLGDIKPVGLFLTHHHVDHAGGARMIWEEYELIVYAHPLDIPYLLKKRRRPRLVIPILGDWLANNVDPIPQGALTAVEEGDNVMGWRVVHLPGHTMGQVGLIKDGVLIAGDALRVGKNGPTLPPSIVNEDHIQARQTVAKIAQMDVKEIYVGHGPATTLEAVQALAKTLGSSPS